MYQVSWIDSHSVLRIVSTPSSAVAQSLRNRIKGSRLWYCSGKVVQYLTDTLS